MPAFEFHFVRGHTTGRAVSKTVAEVPVVDGKEGLRLAIPAQRQGPLIDNTLHELLCRLEVCRRRIRLDWRLVCFPVCLRRDIGSLLACVCSVSGSLSFCACSAFPSSVSLVRCFRHRLIPTSAQVQMTWRAVGRRDVPRLDFSQQVCLVNVVVSRWAPHIAAFVLLLQPCQYARRRVPLHC